MNPTIARIRSGGQTGVDRAALDFARKHNMEICGWCPKGGWAEDYPEAPGVLTVYPELRETPEAAPWQRTLWNMRDADAILTIVPEGSGASGGTELGVQEGIRLGKPMFTARGAEDVPEIVACTPCAKDGSVRPEILFAMKVCGVTEAYRVGGIQAIGMMAYGTRRVPAVEKNMDEVSAQFLVSQVSSRNRMYSSRKLSKEELTNMRIIL